MAFLGIDVRRGEVIRDQVTVGTFADGSPVYVPVMTVGGASDGPTVYLQAGVHGDEVTGIEVLRRVLGLLTPDVVHGRIVAVPVANVPAFVTRTRGYANEERGPIDMNRIFPGDDGGLLTQRIAHSLCREFLEQADYAMDFHSALAGCRIASFTYVQSARDSPLHDGQATLAEAIGAGMVYYQEGNKSLGTSDVTKSFLGTADSLGVPAIVTEMGESGRITWPVVPDAVSGALNALAAIGSLENPPIGDWTPRPAHRFRRVVLTHAQVGGLLELNVELGDKVEAGDTLASIHSVHGEPTQTVEAPESGVVLRLMSLGSCNSGAEVAWIAADLMDASGRG